MGAQAAHFAVAHLAGGEAGGHPIGKGKGGCYVIDGPLGASTTGGGKTHHWRLG